MERVYATLERQATAHLHRRVKGVITLEAGDLVSEAFLRQRELIDVASYDTTPIDTDDTPPIRRRSTLNTIATLQEARVIGSYRMSDGKPSIYSSAASSDAVGAGRPHGALVEELRVHQTLVEVSGLHLRAQEPAGAQGAEPAAQVVGGGQQAARRLQVP